VAEDAQAACGPQVAASTMNHLSLTRMIDKKKLSKVLQKCKKLS
jgi:hypothetical protein